MDTNFSSQMITGRAAKKGLKRIRAAAAEALSVIQVAFQTWDQDGEKKKSRAEYRAQVEQRLEAIKEDLESSVANTIKKGMALRTNQVGYYAGTRFNKR